MATRKFVSNEIPSFVIDHRYFISDWDIHNFLKAKYETKSVKAYRALKEKIKRSGKQFKIFDTLKLKSFIPAEHLSNTGRGVFFDCSNLNPELESYLKKEGISVLPPKISQSSYLFSLCKELNDELQN